MAFVETWNDKGGEEHGAQDGGYVRVSRILDGMLVLRQVLGSHTAGAFLAVARSDPCSDEWSASRIYI